MKQNNYKVGQVVKGDCDNCFDDVDFEYRYHDDRILAFQCMRCGVYNFKNCGDSK